MISIDPFVIFMQILNFTVLVWLMKRFLVGPLTQHMEARASKIEKNIKKSEEKLANAEAIEKDKNQQLQDAYHQAKEIREKAQDAAKPIVIPAANSANALINCSPDTANSIFYSSVFCFCFLIFLCHKN